jgi:hypothetical protein
MGTVSTVRSYIEALGGKLELVATFADGNSCRISQFSELDENVKAAPLPRSKNRRSRKKAASA